MEKTLARLAIPFVTLVAMLILTACGGGPVSPTLSDNGIGQDAETEQLQSEPVPEVTTDTANGIGQDAETEQLQSEPVPEVTTDTAENNKVMELLTTLTTDTAENKVAELRRLAEQGNALAQFVLGLLYARGAGVPQDDAEAVKWLRKAAEQGREKQKEMWRCYAMSDYNKTTALFTLTRGIGGIGDFGEVSVAGTTYLASFRIAGLNRRWDFGREEFLYAFIIKPDDTGLYYDFSTSTDGTAKARDVFRCQMSP